MYQANITEYNSTRTIENDELASQFGLFIILPCLVCLLISLRNT